MVYETRLSYIVIFILFQFALLEAFPKDAIPTTNDIFSV